MLKPAQPIDCFGCQDSSFTSSLQQPESIIHYKAFSNFDVQTGMTASLKSSANAVEET